MAEQLRDYIQGLIIGSVMGALFGFLVGIFLSGWAHRKLYDLKRKEASK